MADGSTYSRSCTCYPSGFKPAEPWRRGCDGEARCKLRDESRELSTPEGRAAWKERYGSWGAERLAVPPEERDVSHRLAKAGVPGQALMFARRPDSTHAIEAAKRWVDAEASVIPGLVLVGEKGTGKSVAAAWAALRWAQKYPWNEMPSGTRTEPFVWLDASGVRRMGDFGADAARIVEQVATAAFVVFDDTGREGSPRSIEALSDALMERCDRSRRFVLTSNLASDPFRQRYGEPLADRLRARAWITQLHSKSMRKPAMRQVVP